MAQPPSGFPFPSHCGALRAGRELRCSDGQVGKHHPRGPGEPEPGLGEGDVRRGLLFQVPKTEVTTPAPCGGGQRTGVGCRSGKGYPTPPIRGHSLRQQEDGFPSPDPHVMPTSSLTFWGLRHGGAQAVHVVTPVAVIAKQQLVLGGETRPAGTLGAWAPETGVGGWGRGQSKGLGVTGPSTRRAPRGLCTTGSLRNPPRPSKISLRPVHLWSGFYKILWNT